MAERRSALVECRKPGTYGALAPAGPGVTIQEIRPLSAVQVSGFDAARAAAAIAAATGAPAPTVRNSVGSTGETHVLWTGPARWLVLEPEHRDLAGLLAQKCSVEVAAVTDLSHARTAFRLEGPAVRSVLAKLCTLDVEAGAFPPGTCAQTIFGQIGVLLHCRTPDCFDILMYRGFAVSAWETVTDAALEFGCRVL